MRYKEIFDTPEKKAEAFDRLAERYYKCNFGTCSKSEVDIIMFMCYLREWEKQLEQKGISPLSYNSDYKIGRELGLTPTKVQNLKVKVQLAYPEERGDWKKTLLYLLENEKNFYIKDEKVFIKLPDKNMYYEIEDFINEEVGFPEYVSDPKTLCLPMMYFIKLIMVISEENERKTLLKAIEKYGQQNGIETAGKKDVLDYLEQIMRTGVSLTEIVGNVAGLVTGTSRITEIIGVLAEKCIGRK